MTVFYAKETVIKNVNIFYILAGFEARWSPDCYDDIDVTFANEINDKKRPYFPCFVGFLQDFLSPEGPPSVTAMLTLILRMK